MTRRLHAALALGALLGVTSLTDAWAAPPKTPPPVVAEPQFDKTAAAQVLSQVDLGKCRATNAPKGENHVTVTFTTTGAASDAVIDSGPVKTSPVAKCVRGKFLLAKIPPFKGTDVQVGKKFRFE